jgi:hypothetical protein
VTSTRSRAVGGWHETPQSNAKTASRLDGAGVLRSEVKEEPESLRLSGGGHERSEIPAPSSLVAEAGALSMDFGSSEP